MPAIYGQAPAAAHDLLCQALLRGERQSWPFADCVADVERFLERVTFHGIECLLVERLACLDACPESVRLALKQLATERALWELRNRRLMQLALEALATAGINTLVYKGTALAYSLYPNPVWRTRSDTDLLVAPDQLQASITVLESLGYRQYSDAEEAIFYKLYFSQIAPEGGEHNIDLHWKLNNSELLSGLFSFTELYSRSVPLPALSGQARTVSHADALLIACLHRGVHKLSAYTVNHKTYYSGDRLIWLQDIDLLARQLQPAEWVQFFECSKAKGLTRICRESLALAGAWFMTSLPKHWEISLAQLEQGLPDRYLAAGPFLRAWLDLQACRNLSAKLGYCRHILCPPATYMHNKFADARWQWLPWLYLRRIVTGLLHRFRLGWQRT